MALIEYDEYKQKLRDLGPELDKLSAALDMDSARAEAQKLEDETAQDGFWNDLERSQKVQQRLKQLQNKITRQDKLVTEWQDLTALCEMGQEADDAELLDFNKKYLSGGKGTKGMQSLQRRIPAPIKPEQMKMVLQLTEDVFRALDMKGVCRIDYIIDQADDKVYVGEINCIPGSLAFYLWEPKGLSFTQLVDKMVEYALRAHTDKNQSTFTFDSSILQNIGRGVKGAKG